MNDINDNTITVSEIIGEAVIAAGSLYVMDRALNKMVWIIINLGADVASRI